MPTSEHPTDNPWSRTELWLLSIGGLGLLSRVALAACSIGCDDALIWFQHAQAIRDQGLSWALTHMEPGKWHYNHPPLAGYWALLSGELSNYELYEFSLWMKVPGLVSECVTAALLFHIGLHRAAPGKGRTRGATFFAVYGTSLPMIAVSGYHCNTDAAYATAALLAVFYMVTRRGPLRAGLWWAVAMNVKLIPLFLFPALLSMCRTHRDVQRFFLGAACAALPFIPFVVSDPVAAYRNMLGYNSLQLDWGLMAFLNHSGELTLWAGALSEVRMVVLETGRYWVLLAALGIALFAYRHRMDGYLTASLTWAAFLILTPGFGVQYAVCVVATLTIADWRRSLVYSFWMGLMLLTVYTLRMQPELPLRALVQYFPFPVLAALTGAVAWFSLVTFALNAVQGVRRDQRENRGRELAPVLVTHCSIPPHASEES